ncbi:hypothetical protein R69619_07271 [Paraburkholderia nemoris]|uniref:hypothetical protein n=1 Tax=Paraburkholderia nemoris TaxID=2793076 RepID=UPI00190BCDA8|nr:hypothetical protein [Paraburkholderia nemoris]MBK3744712.1 hypothetical protein [Paraburkholderia aspalathi]CAE6847032.1 hypothetical protein R69619_07271 [Paraburkholderia nemoris]
MAQIAVTVCSNGAAIVSAAIDGEMKDGAPVSRPALLNEGWTVVNTSGTGNFVLVILQSP